MDKEAVVFGNEFLFCSQIHSHSSPKRIISSLFFLAHKNTLAVVEFDVASCGGNRLLRVGENTFEENTLQCGGARRRLAAKVERDWQPLSVENETTTRTCRHEPCSLSTTESNTESNTESSQLILAKQVFTFVLIQNELVQIFDDLFELFELLKISGFRKVKSDS